MIEHFLPYGRQTIEEEDVQAVTTALRAPCITQGPLVDRFEAALSDYLNAPSVSVVANGTAALQLVYAALQLGPGDEIITSPITFVATANAARALGAEVRFADVEPDTGNLAVASVERLITPRTRGITAVHLGGLPVDLAPLRALADRHGLFLVEDAAHALGATYQGTRVGSCQYSDAATFSFHPVKHLTTGEGGAVATRDAALKRRIDLLRQHGIERTDDQLQRVRPGPWYYEVQALGWNYRLSDFQCALGLAQLRRQVPWLERRRALAARYRRALAARLPGLVEVQAEREGRESAYHLLLAMIRFDQAGRTRAQVMEGLRARNIGTQVHYIPVDQQPYYQDRYGAPASKPGVELFYARALSLPLYPELRDHEVDAVVEGLAAELGR